MHVHMALHSRIRSIFPKDTKTSSKGTTAKPAKGSKSVTSDVTCLKYADRADQLACKVWNSTLMAAF